MSFYLRKSVKAGPFRFNLSKSGVGVSTGVPGFRVGSGPRGNYVRVGGAGVYYRATLGGRQPTAPEPTWQPPAPPPVADVLLEDITGASATELLPTGSGDIVEQLNQAASRWRIFPWALGLLIVILLAQPVVGAVLLLPGIPGLVWLWFNDRARRTVVAFYDVNDAPATWFQDLVDATEGLAGSQALWRVDAAGNVRTTYQYKVNAGAGTIVSRKRAGASHRPPRAFATNIAVPSITAGKSALYFLPDRVLVKDAKRFSDVSYAELQIQMASQRFIESQRPPRDAAQVDTTWQYVNVKGGPDRRFKNNRRLPVMLYGELDLASSGGLHWLLQCSQPAAGEQVAAALLRTPSAITPGVPA
jgi:Protein of unknown function (DUF4236)